MLLNIFSNVQKNVMNSRNLLKVKPTFYRNLVIYKASFFNLDNVGYKYIMIKINYCK